MNKEKLLYLFICSLLWIYICLRAYFVPVMHDEVVSMLYYVHTGKFIPFFSHWDANNHLLNSFLSYLSYLCFGDDVWALRLPNVLAAWVLFYYLWKISLELKSGILRWFFILTMLFSQTFMEFYALSRGYGISMSLLMASISYFILFINGKANRHLFLCCLMITLSVSANLTLLVSEFIFLFYLCFHLLINYFDKKVFPWKSLSLVFVFGVIPSCLFVVLLYFMKEFSLLYYGSMEGLWSGTLNSLLFHFTAYVNFWTTLYVLVASSILMISTIYLISSLGFKNWFFKPFFIFSNLFFGNILAIILMHKIFGNPYPEDRTALYFYPYFICGLFFVIDFLKHNNRFSYSVLLLLPLLFFPLQFLAQLNISHCSLWPKDAIPQSFFKYVHKDAISSGKISTVGGYRMRELCWSYYNYKSGGVLSQIQGANYPSVFEDYQVLNVDTLPNMSQYYFSVYKDSYSGLQLLKRYSPAKRKNFWSLDHIVNKTKIKDEFINFFELSKDSIKSNNLEIDIRFKLSAEVAPFEAWVVFKMFDANDKTLRYQYTSLERIKMEWKNDSFNTRILTVNLPKGGKRMLCYFWNIKKQLFSINDIHVSLDSLSR